MPKKPYHLSHVLKCEFHALWYETECSARAADAEKVIDPRLGKSHSNMPKATFSVLIRLFCQIHHFPRNSSAPLPNPQRFLPNHWLIATFCKFIIFCTKKVTFLPSPSPILLLIAVSVILATSKEPLTSHWTFTSPLVHLCQILHFPKGLFPDVT